MSVKLVCTELSLPYFQVNAMAFIPNPENESSLKKEWALFSHGYTSHKGDCLSWATRLVENGVPCMIFDQPGHYLGSFHEVSSLEDFKNHTHELFAAAYDRLFDLMSIHFSAKISRPQSIILGGHSLGAYMALKAMTLPSFKDLNRIGIGIGIGIGQRQSAHIFETAFYEKTLAIRRQLVSPVLDSKEVFSWLKDAKYSFDVQNERIHLITGEDDVVVGAGGMEAFIDVLNKHHNNVTFEKPKRLPHHEPAVATPHLYAFLKNYFNWT